MNKQMVDLLAKRVKCFWDHGDHNMPSTACFSGDDIYKFAELIVQECVNVLHANELWNRDISHALNEHFGVK